MRPDQSVPILGKREQNLVEPIPEFARFYLTYLRRTDWGDFPEVVIHSDEPVVKKHPSYAAAKAGDADAAQKLVLETATIGALDRICAIIGERRPHLLAVHALEEEGANAIPRVFARLLSKVLDLPVANGIIQIRRWPI